MMIYKLDWTAYGGSTAGSVVYDNCMKIRGPEGRPLALYRFVFGVSTHWGLEPLGRALGKNPVEACNDHREFVPALG